MIVQPVQINHPNRLRTLVTLLSITLVSLLFLVTIPPIGVAGLIWVAVMLVGARRRAHRTPEQRAAEQYLADLHRQARGGRR